MNETNLRKVAKLTKELIFGNLKSYESIVTTAKYLATFENNKIVILNNNIISVERKFNANSSIPCVKYEFMLINDEDDDSEDSDDDGDECGDNKSDNDENEFAAGMFCDWTTIYIYNYVKQSNIIHKK